MCACAANVLHSRQLLLPLILSTHLGRLHNRIFSPEEDGGFYINTGALEFRENKKVVYNLSLDEEDAENNVVAKKVKKPKMEEPVIEQERTPLADRRNRGVRGGSKLSNSTSNLSLEISSIRSQDSLLLGESLTKWHILSNSKPGVFKTEVDGVIVDLKESYVKLTNFTKDSLRSTITPTVVTDQKSVILLL